MAPLSAIEADRAVHHLPQRDRAPFPGDARGYETRAVLPGAARQGGGGIAVTASATHCRRAQLTEPSGRPCECAGRCAKMGGA